MKPSAPWRRPLLTIHVAASGGLLGAALVILALGVSGIGGADARTVYPEQPPPGRDRDGRQLGRRGLRRRRRPSAPSPAGRG